MACPLPNQHRQRQLCSGSMWHWSFLLPRCELFLPWGATWGKWNRWFHFFVLHCAYFKSVGAHWDKSGNKRIAKFKNIKVSLCSELCVLLSEFHTYPLKLAKAAKLIWLFPALQGNLTEVLIGSAERWMQREVHISVVFLVLVFTLIYTSVKLLSRHSNRQVTVPPLIFAF